MDQLYANEQRRGVPGQIVDMSLRSLLSRNVEPVGGIGFGLAVFQGVDDKGIRLIAPGDTAAKFVGVTVRDRSLRDEGNSFLQYDSARVMRIGCVWVDVGAVAVKAGDPVYVIAATGLFTNSATGNILIEGARFDTSNGDTDNLVQLRMD